MKTLLNITLLLFLAHYAAALSPRNLWSFDHAAKRAPEEPNQVEVDERSLICKFDAVLLACKALGPAATTFCASYLHITPTTTVKFTTISSATTLPTTITTTTTTATTSTVTNLDLTTITTTTTSTEAGIVMKRSVGPIVPPPLTKFLAAQISSACSCLSIKAPVTTSTSTVLKVNTAFSTDYATITDTSTIVTTTESTSTDTATATVTTIASCLEHNESCATDSDCCAAFVCRGLLGTICCTPGLDPFC